MNMRINIVSTQSVNPDGSLAGAPWHVLEVFYGSRCLDIHYMPTAGLDAVLPVLRGGYVPKILWYLYNRWLCNSHAVREKIVDLVRSEGELYVCGENLGNVYMLEDELYTNEPPEEPA